MANNVERVIRRIASFPSETVFPVANPVEPLPDNLAEVSRIKWRTATRTDVKVIISPAKNKEPAR